MKFLSEFPIGPRRLLANFQGISVGVSRRYALAVVVIEICGECLETGENNEL